jgi:hypothetical protein
METWKAGFDGHLVKPVTFDMLHALPRYVAGRRSRRWRDNARLSKAPSPTPRSSPTTTGQVG